MERRLNVEIGADLTSLDRGLSRAGQSINQFAQNTQQVGNRMAGAFDRPRDAVGRFLATGQRAGAQLSAAFGPQISQAIGRIGDAADRAGKKLSVGLSVPIGALLVKMSSAYGESDKMARGLANLEKNAESLTSRLKLLNEISKLPGINFKEAQKGDIQLRYTMERLYGIKGAADQSIRTLKGFSNATALAGKGSVEFGRAIYGVQQLLNTEFPLGEDLNIIKEALPQIVPLLDAAFGSARSDALRDMGVTSKQIFETILTGLEKLPAASGGWANALENMSSAANQSLAKIAGQLDRNLGLTEFVNRVSGLMERAADAFIKLDPSAQNLIALLGGITVAAGPLLVAFGFLLTSVIPALVAGFAALATPIGATVAAIVVAGALIVANWDAIKQTLKDTGVWDAVAGAVTTAKTAIVSAWGYVMQVLRDNGVWAEMVNLATAAFDLLKSGLTVVGQVFRGEWGGFPAPVRVAFTQIVTVLQGAFSLITGLFSDMLTAVSGVMNVLSGVLTGDWRKIEQGVTKIAAGLVNGLIGLFTGGFALIGRLFANFVESLGADGIAASIRSGMNSLESGATRIRAGFRAVASPPGAAPKPGVAPPLPKPNLYPGYNFGGDRTVAAPSGGEGTKLSEELDKAQNRLKALRAEIAGYNLKGLKVPPALMAEYNALSKRVKAATDATKLAKVPKEVIDSFKIPATDVEYWQGRVESITKSIDRLREKGLPVSEASIKSLEVATERVEHFKKLADDFKDREIKLTVRVTQTGETTTSKARAGQANSPETPLPTGLKSIFASGANGAPPPLPHFDKFMEQWKEAQEKTTAAATAFRSALDASQELIAQGFAGFLVGIGESIGSGGNPLKAALKAILSFIADYAIRIGTAALISSAALTAAAPFLGGLTLPQGIGLKVAGAGLVLAGGLIKGMIGGGGRREMASGGLVYGRTDATIGEYAGAATDPELVGRLSTVTRYINQAVSSAIGPLRSTIGQLKMPSMSLPDLSRLPTLSLPNMSSMSRPPVLLDVRAEPMGIRNGDLMYAIKVGAKGEQEFYGKRPF